MGSTFGAGSIKDEQVGCACIRTYQVQDLPGSRGGTVVFIGVVERYH